LFNPITSSEANPLAPVDAAHPLLAMCVGALFETSGEGSAGTLLADGVICKIWGIAGHRPKPPPINPSSSSHGLPPALVAATHHMRMMGGVALSKMAGNTRLRGGCVGVVWGRFLCGGWVVGPPPKTNLVCLFPVTGRPSPGILRCATLLASNGRRGWTQIRRRRQNQGYFKGGGGFYGRVGGWTTTVSNHRLTPSGIWTPAQCACSPHHGRLRVSVICFILSCGVCFGR
jgi:hypothetical protein